MEIEEYARIAAAEDDHWWYRNTRAVMGDLKMGRLGTVTGWSVAALIIGLNVFLLYETFAGGSGGV